MKFNFLKVLLFLIMFLPLTLAEILLNRGAAVTSGSDSRGNQYYYSSYPMPNATWKTKIALKAYGTGLWVVAAPFYYYGDNINSDIIKLRTFLISKGIAYRDGVCITFPYTQPCLR